MSGVTRLYINPNTQIWTANNCNLTFPNCRGDVKKYDETKNDKLHFFQSENRHKTDNNLETYEEALSAEVYGFLSWLQNTTQQLSKVGTSLYHPDPYSRIDPELAKRILHISKTDAKRREKFLRRLLNEARDFISVTKKGSVDEKGAENDLTLYGREFFRKNRGDLGISFSESHLNSIERHWELLCVQIKVLSIQLFENGLVEFDDKHFEGKNFDILQRLSEKCKTKKPSNPKSKDQQYYSSNLDGLWPYSPRSITQTSSRSNYSSMSEDTWTEHSNLAVKNTDAESQVSGKDDGYHSNAGGSTSQDLCSTEEGLSDTGVDLAIKDLNSLNKELGIFVNNEENSKPCDVSSRNEATSKGGPGNEEWEKVNDMVEEFSSNVMTLLSWIEEMRDIMNCRRNANKTYFYSSNQDRLDNASCHVTKLYEMVQIEASLLRERLPSEYEVIGNILKKVETHYGHVYEPLRPKPAPQRDLADDNSARNYSRRPTIPLQQVTSVALSPRAQEKQSVEIDGGKMKIGNRQESSIQSYVSSKPANSPIKPSPPLTWLKFVNHQNSLVEWVIRLHLMVDDVEVCYLAANQRRRLYEDYLFTVSTEKSKLDKFVMEGDILSEEFPEYSLDVYKKTNDVKRQWSKLETRLRNKCRDFGDEFLPNAKAFESFHFDIEDRIFSILPRRQMAAMINTPIDIADHSFHNIRDKSSFDDRRSTKDSCHSPIYNSKESPRIAYSEGVLSVADLNSSSNQNLMSTPNQTRVPKPFYETMPAEISLETIPDVQIDHVDGAVQSELGKLFEDSVVECDRAAVTSTELADRIAKFQAWLKVEESDSYNKQEPKSPGWCLEYLQELRDSNNHKKARLESKQSEITHLVALSENQLKLEDKKIDNDKLLWAYLMLEQRYINLLLYYVDTEFMLERRIDVLTKNCRIADVVAHPLDEVWTDSGTPVQMFPDHESEDYAIMV